MQTTLEVIHRHLTDLGYKHTPVRSRILEYFLQTSCQLLSAQEILEKLYAQGVSINKTTLYRQLHTLSIAQVLSVQVGHDAITRYELVFKTHHHHHFVCTECQKTQKIPTENIETEIQKLESLLEKQGFSIQAHHLDMQGVCPECH